jgi:DNA-binding SARP family transcriptional activator/tetratricopeptide (TPR) repeat protein
MRLKLLGPLELAVDRRSLDIGGPRQRIILSMLGLNANRVTPVEQLIDAVWDTSPPSTARAQIQICISALRKLFGDAGHPEVIRTYPPGYLLEISASELDSEEFAGLVVEARRQADHGRIAAAAATLRNALGLWRGAALSGVQSGLVRRGAALLEDGRLTAVEERIRLDLALGQHQKISGELAALVDEYPLRERLYGFLMLALYRSGRQAEALEVHRRARTVLIEELGIEPGQELQDLERAILNRAPTLDLPVGDARPTALADERPTVEQPIGPRQLPCSIADFTGRESHIAEICRVLSNERRSALAPYAVRIMAISGKGGVGKTSLAIRVAHELATSFPDGHLYGDFQSPAGDDRTATLLVRFLRALGVSGSAIPEDVQERAEMYRSLLASKRLLVVLDDVTSEEQVRPLLPGSPNCAVIVTSRVRLSGLSGADWVDVDVFDTDKSVELLSKIVGSGRVRAEQDAAVELVQLCGGLPLALRIAGARLASRPHWRIGGLVRRLADEARRLDEFTHRGLELRSNIGLTYRALPLQAQRLFRLFALVQAPDFPGWTAAALLDTDLVTAGDLLESLVDARMMDTVEYPGERVRYRFHALIRVYALERLAEAETAFERQSVLAKLLGAWLALAEEAHRREYGGDYTILHSAAQRWRPPMDESAVTMENPIDWWDGERTSLVAAVRQAAAAGLDELCWDLALTSVTLFEVKGYFDLWRENAELGLKVTERAGNRTGKAAMLYSLGTLHMFQKRLAEAEQCFAAALEIFDADNHTHGRALVLRNSAQVNGLYGNATAMLAKYADALELMKAVGDHMGEAQILRSLAKFWIDEGDNERARAMLDEALGICQRVKCLRGEAQVVYLFAHLYLETDQIELARQSLHRVLLIVRDIGDRIGETYALCGLGIVRHREGRPESAETTLLHALALARQVGERLIEGEALYALGEVGLATGNSSAAAAHLTEAGRLFEELGSVLWRAKTLGMLSEVHVANGDIARAADDLQRAVALLTGVASKEAARWLTRLETALSTLLANDLVGRGGVGTGYPAPAFPEGLSI